MLNMPSRLNMQTQVKDLLLEPHRYFQLLQLFVSYVFILLRTNTFWGPVLYLFVTVPRLKLKKFIFSKWSYVVGVINTFRWMAQLMEGGNGNRAIHCYFTGPDKIHDNNA